MKQATVTTQVIHTVEFDETRINPEQVAEYIYASVLEIMEGISTPIVTISKTDVIKDPSPTIVPLWS
jgi:hypothetical protein